MNQEQRNIMAMTRKIVESNPERHNQEVYLAIRSDDYDSQIEDITFGGFDAEELRTYAMTPVPEEPQQESGICKTVGCVAGWASALAAPKGSKLKSYGVILPGEGTRSHGYSDYATAVLGINVSAADWLFSATRSREEVLWALGWLPAHPDAVCTDIISAVPDDVPGSDY